jgi:hypothetical protein
MATIKKIIFQVNYYFPRFNIFWLNFTQMLHFFKIEAVEKTSWDLANDGKILGLEHRRNAPKLWIKTFACRSSTYLFYAWTKIGPFTPPFVTCISLFFSNDFESRLFICPPENLKHSMEWNGILMQLPMCDKLLFLVNYKWNILLLQEKLLINPDRCIVTMSERFTSTYIRTEHKRKNIIIHVICYAM